MDFLQNELITQNEKMKEMMEIVSFQQTFMIDHQKRLQLKLEEEQETTKKLSSLPSSSSSSGGDSSSEILIESGHGDGDDDEYDRYDQFFSHLAIPTKFPSSAQKRNSGGKSVVNRHRSQFSSYLKGLLQFFFQQYSTKSSSSSSAAPTPSTKSSSSSSSDSSSTDDKNKKPSENFMISMFADLYTFFLFHITESIRSLFYLV